MCKQNIEKMVIDNKNEKKDKEVLVKIEKMLEYATKKYGCKFSKNLHKRLYEIAYEKKVPQYKIIDALAKSWEIWEPYVSANSFDSFMEIGIKAIFKIHGTAITSSPGLKSYIGNKATVVKSIPGPLSTVITLNGELLKNGVVIPV